MRYSHDFHFSVAEFVTTVASTLALENQFLAAVDVKHMALATRDSQIKNSKILKFILWGTASSITHFACKQK